LVGGNGGSASNCFWDTDTQTHGVTESIGYNYGTVTNVVGLPTTQMQTKSTFTDVGWDFVGEAVNGPNDIWDICEGMNYPKLSWQIPPLGDFGCPDGINFVDFSFLASHWAEDNCGASIDCESTDLDQSGTVDSNDLVILADNWLEGLKPLNPPMSACDPDPTDGAIIVSITADLSWTAGLGATSHDVYFGTSNPPPFISNQTTTIFDPGKMASSTKYYWCIYEVNMFGKAVSPTWSFTTLSGPPPPPPT
jgi:hypothetical protein